MNPWLQRRGLVYAHQGGAKEAPSSTLAAFRRAVSLGCHGLEMDVHRTRDGHLVVSHDETVDRTSNASGRISELTLDELRELDNAYWFVDGEDVATGRPQGAYVHRGRAPRDPSYGYATLDEVLDEFTGVFINLDIKETSPTVEPYERLLAQTLRRHHRSDGVIVASFHDDALRAFRRDAPDVATSLGPEEVLAVGMAIAGEGPEPHLGDHLVALQVPTHFGDVPIVTERFVRGCHERNLAVHVWTLDTMDEIERVLAMDVDAVITDCPTVALQAI